MSEPNLWSRRDFNRTLSLAVVGSIFVPKFGSWFRPNRIIVPASTRLSVYWKRATHSAEAVPSLAGDRTFSRILTFRQGPVPMLVGTGPINGGFPPHQPGDVALLMVATGNGPIDVRPSGWTLVQEGGQPPYSPFQVLSGISRRDALKRSLRVA